MNKKLATGILVGLAAIVGFECYFWNKSQDVKSVDEPRANTPLDKNLYGVEYDDFDFNLIMNVGAQKWGGANCSEVRRGNYIGRNLDWYINNDATAIVKVNAHKGETFEDTRFASIAVQGSMPEFSNSFAESGEYSDLYKVLPVSIVDGINENGVYMGINVTATGETSFDRTKWNSGAWGLGANKTNCPESDKEYCVVAMIRVVLDHAKDLEEAKQLIKSINWYEPIGFPHKGESQAFHWLLCDANKSCVVEFIDGQIYFNDADDTQKPSYGTIMTNFSNTLLNPEYAETPIYQVHGCGYERWNILAKNYDMASDAEGMFDLMSKVWYTTAYTKPMDSEDFLFSEFYSNKYPAGMLYTNGNEMWKDEGFRAVVEKAKSDFANKQLWHTAETPLWYTTHTSVYDIEKRELRVFLHEGLDGMKECFKADLNSSFAKPLIMQ